MSSSDLLEEVIHTPSKICARNLLVSKSRQFKPLDKELSIDFGIELTASQIGVFSLNDQSEIGAFYIQMNEDISARNSRFFQFEIGKRILKDLSYQNLDAIIIFFVGSSGDFRLSFIHAEYSGQKRTWSNFKRFSYFVSKELSNKTFKRQILQSDFQNYESFKKAFSISAVTDFFYAEFIEVFNRMVAETKKGTPTANEDTVSDFVLLFVIRVIFLGFIQEKSWLGKDRKFLQNLIYHFNVEQESSIYKHYFEPLFFEALNKSKDEKTTLFLSINNSYVKESFVSAPYLNGGLFKIKTGFDDKGISPPNKAIIDFFDFLFSHSFTIEENSSIDEDLQLNPEFLGIIFERLINKEDGAVYTPRTEVDLMCRMSLVHWLDRKTGENIRIENLYELFFREGETEDDQRYGSFSKNDAKLVSEHLKSVTVCDPAVGSGAFLVGMMNVICEVESRLNSQLGLPQQEAFSRKSEIIRTSLYGVEVKEWAVWICQLRLWLSIFIEAPDNLVDSLSPILPSLDFKVRRGDSLIQGVGKKSIPIFSSQESLRDDNGEVAQLILEKSRFYENSDSKSQNEIENLERELLLHLLENTLRVNGKTIEKLKLKIGNAQSTLFGEVVDAPLAGKFGNELARVVLETEKIQEQINALNEENMFIWSLDFIEVFSAKGGFDLVIGNPPYIRHEKITDPMPRSIEASEYKLLLERMALLDYPDYFATSPKISSRSDLYCYFYLRGLRLLNLDGVLNYICSNSWLDIGYGAWLKRFLVVNSSIRYVIENQANRSFDSADVNSVITLITKYREPDKLESKFISFKLPFEFAINSHTLIEIEQSSSVVKATSYRSYPINFFGDNAEAVFPSVVENLDEVTSQKWGTKYFRSPDSYLRLLERNEENLSPLVDFAEVIGYVHDNNTGNNYPQVLFVKSIKDLNSILLKPATNGVVKYGVNPAGNSTRTTPILFARTYGYDHLVPYNPDGIVGKEFYRVQPFENAESKNLALVLNSTFGILQKELIGSVNLGGGGIKFSGDDIEKFLLPNRHLEFPEDTSEVFLTRTKMPIFQELGFEDTSLILDPSFKPKPPYDRAVIDKVVFDFLSMSDDEVDTFYREVAILIHNRKIRSES